MLEQRSVGVPPLRVEGRQESNCQCGDADAPPVDKNLPVDDRLPMTRRALSLILAAAAAIPLAQALRTVSAEPRLAAALALASVVALALSLYSLVRESCGVSPWLRRLGFAIGLITCGAAVGLWLLLSQQTLKSVPRSDVVLIARVARAADVVLWLAAALAMSALATLLLPPPARPGASSRPPAPPLS